MKRLLLAAVALACAIGCPSHAQTVTVTGANITDSTGNPLASGTISFAPTDLAGNPISYRMGGKGQTLDLPVTATVTNGAFSIVLPDTEYTNPLHVCFATTVTDNVTGQSVLGLGYKCVQPSSNTGVYGAGFGWCTATTCDFDSYTPRTPGIAVIATGPQGIQGLPGAGFIAGLTTDGANGVTVQGKAIANGILGTTSNNNAVPNDAGTYLNWNMSGGSADSDFVNMGTSSVSGGFAWYTAQTGSGAPGKIASLDAQGNFNAATVTTGTLSVTKAIRLPGIDLNTLGTCGYYDGNNFINGPPAFYANYMEVQVVCSADPNYEWQFAYDMTGGASADLYYSRSKVGGTWGGWVQR